MFEQLAELEKLQNLDIELNAIQKKKGDLPQEIQDLGDELKKLKYELEDIEEQVLEQNQAILAHREKSKDLEELIQKLQEDQADVKNDQEYEEISKERESHELDLALEKKSIKSCYHTIAVHDTNILDIKNNLEQKQKLLDRKKENLATIHEASKAQEDKLRGLREKQLKKVTDPFLMEKYQKAYIKQKPITSIVCSRGSCKECAYIVPTQKQIEIRKNKRIISCENCGCILVSTEKPIKSTPTNPRKSRAKA